MGCDEILSKLDEAIKRTNLPNRLGNLTLIRMERLRVDSGSPFFPPGKDKILGFDLKNKMKLVIARVITKNTFSVAIEFRLSKILAHPSPSWRIRNQKFSPACQKKLEDTLRYLEELKEN